jgi:hypothetical protein
MKRFLILAETLDVHADYVSWALKTAGYETTFINGSHDNVPTRASLYLDEVTDAFTSPDWEDAEAVWCRRLPKPPMADKGQDENEAFTIVQERRFTRWLIELHALNGNIRWVNAPAAALASENKLAQLKIARSLGLAVPRTLITAQPERFRAFLRSEGTVVAKPFTGYSWEYESGLTLTAFASLLDSQRGSELSDQDIARCITIYQQRIAKAYDVRMLVMGTDVFAYKVIQDGEQHFDFRVGFYQEGHLKYEAIPVPALLKRKMAGFIKALQINFASADFAVTADGEWVFLDLNPSGQWLFVEAACPEARVGQKFCSFFVLGRGDPGAEDLFPSYSEYTESEAAKALHEAFRRLSTAEASPANNWKEREA